ncbi:hypothetical protein NKH77_06125 [Streptomyces sp. M19]
MGPAARRDAHAALELLRGEALSCQDAEDWSAAARARCWRTSTAPPN